MPSIASLVEPSKEVSSKTLAVAHAKKDGYHWNGLAESLECTAPACHYVSGSRDNFYQCVYCKTIYCCRSCQLIDWSRHWTFCLSLAGLFSSLDEYMERVHAEQLSYQPLIIELIGCWAEQPAVVQHLRQAEVSVESVIIAYQALGPA